MDKKTYIRLGEELYVAELQDGIIHSRDNKHTGRMFRIINKKGEVCACLSVFLSSTTRAIWKQQYPLTQEIEEKLFIRILPYIPFEATIEDFTCIYNSCVELFFVEENWYDKMNSAQFIQSYASPHELVNALVFEGEMDEEKLQKDILSYLYEVHVKDSQAVMNTGELAKALFVDEKMVFRCLKYLEDEGHIEGKATVDAGGIVYSNITTLGAKYVRSNFQQIYSGTGVIVMGDYVGKDKITTAVNGNGNNTAVKSTISNSFNTTEVHQKADKLIETIKQEYHGDDKEELIAQVEEVKILSSDEKNFSKIRGILGGVMNRTAQAIAIATAAYKLYGMFTGGAQ